MKNKYVQRSRISEKKFKEILKYFALDLQANQIAELTGISRNSINSYTKAIRLALIRAHNTQQNRHSVTGGTMLLFGVEAQNHMISVEPLPGHSNHEIYKAIRRNDIDAINAILPKTYSGLIDFSTKRFVQLQHPLQSQSQNLEVSAFWGYTKTRLVKFRGISTQNIYLHLKECEFRYNNRDKDLYRYLLTFFRKQPLHLQ